MFTLVISLVVVVGAVAAVTTLVVREMPQPAMDDPERHRAPRQADPSAPPAGAPPSAQPPPVGGVMTPVAAPPTGDVAGDAPPAFPRPRFTLTGESAPPPTRSRVAAPATIRSPVAPATIRSPVVPAALPPTPLWHRIRSAIALVSLVTVLGVGAAVTIGAVVIGLVFAARQALG